MFILPLCSDTDKTGLTAGVLMMSGYVIGFSLRLNNVTLGHMAGGGISRHND